MHQRPGTRTLARDRPLRPEAGKHHGHARRLVKILDFGLARVMQSRAAAPGVVTPHPALRIEGTVGYMSPEQAAGRPAA